MIIVGNGFRKFIAEAVAKSNIKKANQPMMELSVIQIPYWVGFT